MHLHSVAHNGPHTVEGDMVLIGPLRGGMFDERGR
jgi:hypothetical protein